MTPYVPALHNTGDDGAGIFPLTTDDEFNVLCGCISDSSSTTEPEAEEEAEATTPPAAGGGAMTPPTHDSAASSTYADGAATERPALGATAPPGAGGGATASPSSDSEIGAQLGTPSPTTVARGIIAESATPAPDGGTASASASGATRTAPFTGASGLGAMATSAFVGVVGVAGLLLAAAAV